MSNSDESVSHSPRTFDLKPGEVAVVQLANGDELQLTYTQLIGSKATLAIQPGEAIKRVLKLVQ